MKSLKHFVQPKIFASEPHPPLFVRNCTAATYAIVTNDGGQAARKT
jgi:hypothetical protein